MVSQRAETNMQLASYNVRHHNRISQVTNVGAMNPTSISRLRELKIKEDARTSDPPAMPKINANNWPKTMDTIQNYFTCILGETKAPPLAYAVRDEAAVIAEADDPPANYHTPDDEMVERMPHQDANGDLHP